jgi:hypothetical protein
MVPVSEVEPPDESGLLRDEVTALRQEVHQLGHVVTELRYEIYVTLDRRLHARALRYIAAVVVIALALATVTWRVAEWGVRQAVKEVAARDAGDCASRAEGREGTRIVASGVARLTEIASLLPAGKVRTSIEDVNSQMEAALTDQLAPAHCIDSGELVVDKGQPPPPSTTTTRSSTP